MVTPAGKAGSYHWRPLIKGFFGVALIVGAVMSSAFRAENWIRWP
jgi:hypothetical protein